MTAIHKIIKSTSMTRSRIMNNFFSFFSVAIITGNLHAQVKYAEPVIKVNLAQEKGPMKPIWAWFGYDEPNYTYMKDGKKLLSELAALSPVPVYVRTHSLLCSG